MNVRSLWFLGLVGLIAFVDPGFSGLRWFFLFFFAPLAADLVRAVGRMRGRAEGGGVSLPLPAPAGGPIRFLLRHWTSLALSVLNPRQFAQGVRQAVGGVRARRRVAVPPAPDTYRQRARYTLPVRGEWLVMNGGVTPEASHAWDVLAQRYAYDLVKADDAGVRHRGAGTSLEDYYAYGEPVVAPADGEVVRVRDGVRDAPRVGTGRVDWRCRDFAGNTVMIRHAEREYSVLAHLVPGSIPVRVGQRVERGERIGRCGHSGHSTEPHLHLQVQDRPDFFDAVGLPVRFSDVRVSGGRAEAPIHLTAGMRVRALELRNRARSSDHGRDGQAERRHEAGRRTARRDGEAHVAEDGRTQVRARDYAPADRDGCLAVFESNVSEFFLPSEREEFEAFLGDLPGPYLVLEDAAGRVVACGGYAVAPGTATADLCWGMVLRELQGTGLGRRLTEARLARIRRDGVARAVALRTSQHTRGFYERLGFATERVVPDGVAPGLDRCEMRLELGRRSEEAVS
ncbi:MAG: GNAT family N-acetyltransferase [Gemmatimonadota bacterium]